MRSKNRETRNRWRLLCDMNIKRQANEVIGDMIETSVTFEGEAQIKQDYRGSSPDQD